MKIERIEKELKKQGAVKVHEDHQQKGWTLKNAYVSICHNIDSDHVQSIHVKRFGDLSDSQSDYFPGSFYHTIKGAIHSALSY